MRKSPFLIPLIAVFLTAQLTFSTANSATVAENIIKSRQILAKKGNADAQFKLASMYELGIGTDINLSQATHWYSEATKTGHNEAKKRLNYLDIKQNGFNKKSHGDWLDRIKKEAKGKNGQSLMLLGQLYSYGLGVPKDLDKAFNLLNRAHLNNPVVLFELDRIESERKKVAAIQQKRNAEAEKKRAQTKKAEAKKPIVAAKKKVLTKEEKRRRYDAMMAKLREEERILAEEQAWAEGKTPAKPSTTKVATKTVEQNAKSRRYIEMMRKMKEEERIMNEQQVWAEAN